MEEGRPLKGNTVSNQGEDKDTRGEATARPMSSRSRPSPRPNTLKTGRMVIESGTPSDLNFVHGDETTSCDSTSVERDRQDGPLCSLSYKIFQHGSQVKKLYMMEKAKKKRYSCSLCGKKFVLKGMLAKHNVLHFADKCNICDKIFYQRRQLERHMLSHPGTKLYVCITCRKGFHTKELLNEHSLIHTKASETCEGRPLIIPIQEVSLSCDKPRVPKKLKEEDSVKQEVTSLWIPEDVKMLDSENVWESDPLSVSPEKDIQIVSDVEEIKKEDNDHIVWKEEELIV